MAEKEILENGSTNTTACPFAQSQLTNDDEINKFHILDETEDNEDSDNYYDDEDSDVPDDEIEKMLEEALATRKRKAGEAGLDSDSISFEEKFKVVLIEKGQNHFDVLPEGWIQVSHNSGMPIYLHKSARVCTLSKPYFLGPGSARKHQVPITAIPCLHYKTATEKEKAATLRKEQEINSDMSIINCNGNFNHNIPNAKIETVQENLQRENLTPEQLKEYCEKVFEFQCMKVLRFKSWAERRKFSKRRKQEKQLQRPTLPDGTKLITFPIRSAENSENSVTTKEWTMNPNGKSYVCILHEYVQHALKKQPTYQFTELENAATPYAATVIIKDMKYGTGFGASKKQAKSEAAKSTLEILIPEMKSKITLDEKSGTVKKYCTILLIKVILQNSLNANFDKNFAPYTN